MAERADVVIVGAGCAGLSLAARLADPALGRALAGRRVVVVDGRTAFPRDRTWCYWDVHPHPFAAAATHNWTRWRVATARGVVERGSARYAYRHVPADAFYAEALARVRRAPHVALRLGAPVRAVTDEGEALRVDTAAGPIHAACVFDSRPPGPPDRGGSAGGAPRLVQAFAGAVVRTAAPAFDPAAATLMDFTAPWDGPGVGFGYVLPYAADEALVELAVIAPAAPAPEALERALARYVRRLTGGRPHEARLREAGVIPMDASRVERRPSPRVVRVGLAGGMARPSTGYAFLAIQRDAAAAADALAQALAGGGPPGAAALCTRLGDPLGAGAGAWLGACARPPRGGAAGWLDRVFLGGLASDFAAAPALFARLFAAAPPDALVRFLSDVATPGDVARVVGALPVLPFAAEAGRTTLAAVRAAVRRPTVSASDNRARPAPVFTRSRAAVAGRPPRVP